MEERYGALDIRFGGASSGGHGTEYIKIS
jgi:hypothetical protein